MQLITQEHGSDDATPVHAVEEPALTVIVPTRNERDNIGELLGRLDVVAPEEAIEIVFVDDSDDGTGEVVEALRAGVARDVRLIHRSPGDRTGGLGGAVCAGLQAARGTWVCVMDADLQHPPELIERLLDEARAEDADVVVASRFRAGGEIGNFGPARRMLSRGAALAAHAVFPRRLRGVTDPMSGFFVIRRAAVDAAALRPRGFKILLEILARSRPLRAREVGFRFGERHAGESKASVGEARHYLAQLADLRFGPRERRLAGFVAVGVSGLAVNTLLLAAFTEGLGLYYLASAVLATQGSSLWNFTLADRLVFKDGDARHSRMHRFLLFLGVNNAALALRGPLLVALTSLVGFNYLVANVVSLVTLTLARFALADLWIWSSSTPAGPHLYDIHGIVTVASDVALPELARLRVAELHNEPTIRVRIGGQRPVAAAAASNGNGNGHHNGNGNGHHNGNGNGRVLPPTVPISRLDYKESLGRFGFGADIQIGERVDVVATPLLRRSPHVLYTNVVEPILRWTLVDKGYALVHAACLASDDRALLLTARTDTGKTTTCLKALDNAPYSFLSDDLTLITPDGRALTYPKPLTISRHTLKAVKKAQLSRRERTGLILQSRLHSRSGRRFAMLLARTHLPVATVNAIIQLLVPPPKYQVDRLIPGVAIAPEASVCAMVVIQRGADEYRPLDPAEALDTLLSNCEDAYGFPPYSDIEHLLHSRNGADLRARERNIIANALQGAPATLVASSTMDWWRSIPSILEPPVPAAPGSP
jgi:glycosyltransferase involved in cell wall biosynthesis